MEKRFCDRCGKEIEYESLGPNDSTTAGLNEDEFGAELFKAIKITEPDNVDRLYSASYKADLCKDCQTKLNNLVRMFMANHEG